MLERFSEVRIHVTTDGAYHWSSNAGLVPRHGTGLQVWSRTLRLIRGPGRSLSTLAFLTSYWSSTESTIFLETFQLIGQGVGWWPVHDAIFHRK